MSAIVAVAEYRRDGIDEGALAVGAGAIGKDEPVFARVARSGVSAIALQESL
jgi:hypothetical protein